MRKTKIKNKNDGYVMLLITVIFVLVTVVIIFGISTPIIKQIFAQRDIWGGKQSYYLSEAGTEDVMHRLKESSMNGYVGSTETLSLDGFNAVTQISNSLDGKIITTLSDQGGYKKTIETEVIQGTGTSFNYGIQAGNGGFHMTGGSRIIGNVYSNGDIIGGSGVHITGSAIAASAGTLFEDENNKTPTPAPSSITFNNAYASRDFAQSFKPSTTSSIMKFSIYIKKTNSPGNFEVALMSDNSGNPNNVLTSTTLYSSNVTSNFGWVDLVFPQSITLNKDTNYWFVIKGVVGKNKTDTNTYSIAANNLYSRGVVKTGQVGSSMTDTGLDGYFSLKLGSLPSKIFGDEGDYFYIGSTSTDVAWASDVSHISLIGNMYCQTGTNNYGGKTCNTSKGIPDTLPTPISEANIDAWKDEAAAGGTYNGNMTIGWAGGTIGPKKITGTLTVNGGGTLLITGTLWVQGNIILTGGGKIKISSSLGANSVIILTDGYTSVDGGAHLEGSGTSGSYPILVSTSDCPHSENHCTQDDSAIYLSGGAGSVVLNAPYGKIHMNGGSGARSLNADLIYIDGGGTVTYEAGLVHMSFSSGPSGGWQISGWKELEN